MASFADLAREIDRQTKTRVDLRAPSRSLRVETGLDGLRRLVVTDEAQAVSLVSDGLAVPGLSTYEPPFSGERGVAAFGLHDNGAIQLHDWLGVPDRWADNLSSALPALYDTVVNSLVAQRPWDERRTVRAVDGAARAVLSDNYLPLDNADLLERAVLPLLESRDDLLVRSADMSDTRLYLALTTERLRADIRVGDPVQAMVVIRNSEFGNGALAVESAILRLTCLNGAVVQTITRKRHAGVKVGGEGVLDHDFRLTDEAQEARDKALWLTLRDAVGEALSETSFAKLVDKQRDAAVTHLVGRPDKVVETVGKKYGLNEEQRYRTLENLLQGRDRTQFDVAQAITLQAHSATPDAAYDLQVVGGSILTLSPTEWRILDPANK